MIKILNVMQYLWSLCTLSLLKFTLSCVFFVCFFFLGGGGGEGAGVFGQDLNWCLVFVPAMFSQNFISFMSDSTDSCTYITYC